MFPCVWKALKNISLCLEYYLINIAGLEFLVVGVVPFVGRCGIATCPAPQRDCFTDVGFTAIVDKQDL